MSTFATTVLVLGIAVAYTVIGMFVNVIYHRLRAGTEYDHEFVNMVSCAWPLAAAIWLLVKVLMKTYACVGGMVEWSVGRRFKPRSITELAKRKYRPTSKSLDGFPESHDTPRR